MLSRGGFRGGSKLGGVLLVCIGLVLEITKSWWFLGVDRLGVATEGRPWGGWQEEGCCIYDGGFVTRCWIWWPAGTSFCPSFLFLVEFWLISWLCKRCRWSFLSCCGLIFGVFEWKQRDVAEVKLG